MGTATSRPVATCSARWPLSGDSDSYNNSNEGNAVQLLGCVYVFVCVCMCLFVVCL